MPLPACRRLHGWRDPLHHRSEARQAGGLGDNGQRHARVRNRGCAEPETERAERDRRSDLPYCPHRDR